MESATVEGTDPAGRPVGWWDPSASPSQQLREPLPPTPSPKRRGGAEAPASPPCWRPEPCLLPLSASGRGLGGGVLHSTQAREDFRGGHDGAATVLELDEDLAREDFLGE